MLFPTMKEITEETLVFARHVPAKHGLANHVELLSAAVVEEGGHLGLDFNRWTTFDGVVFRFRPTSVFRGGLPPAGPPKAVVIALNAWLAANPFPSPASGAPAVVA